MKTVTIVISVISLAVILLTAAMVFKGTLSHDRFITYTNMATIAWFVCSPFWLAPKKKNV
jgi:hypothetical protein